LILSILPPVVSGVSKPHLEPIRKPHWGCKQGSRGGEQAQPQEGAAGHGSASHSVGVS